MIVHYSTLVVIVVLFLAGLVGILQGSTATLLYRRHSSTLSMMPQQHRHCFLAAHFVVLVRSKHVPLLPLLSVVPSTY